MPGTPREGSTFRIPSAPITQPAATEAAYSPPVIVNLHTGLLCEATWALGGAVFVSFRFLNVLFIHCVLMARMRPNLFVFRLHVYPSLPTANPPDTYIYPVEVYRLFVVVVVNKQIRVHPIAPTDLHGARYSYRAWGSA